MLLKSDFKSLVKYSDDVSVGGAVGDNGFYHWALQFGLNNSLSSNVYNVIMNSIVNLKSPRTFCTVLIT